MKFYFVCFEWQHHEWDGSGKLVSDTNEIKRDIIDMHPLQYELDFNAEWGHSQPSSYPQTPDHTFRDTCKVLSWQQLSEEEYTLFQGQF